MWSDSEGMGTFCAVLVLLASLSKCSSAVSLDEAPDARIWADVGDAVTLACDLRDVENRRVHWYEMQTERYLSVNRLIYRRLPGSLRSRLSIVGDSDREQFNLRIRDLRLSDSGTYVCRYAYPGGPATTVARTNLTVYVAPSGDSPWCEMGSSEAEVEYSIGDQMNLRCTSSGTPPPRLEFSRAGSPQVLATGVGSLTLQWRLMAGDNGVDFTCTMHSPVIEASRQCSLTPLKLIPRATVLPTTLRAEEGSTVSLQCQGIGVPSITGYRWELRSTSDGGKTLLDRYSIDRTNPLLEISSVRENITAICFVITPAGLSSSSTGWIEVIPAIPQTTQATILTTGTLETQTIVSQKPAQTDVNSSVASPSEDEISICPTPSQPVIITFPLLATITASMSAILATLTLLVCFCCLRKNRKNRQHLLPVGHERARQDKDRNEDYLTAGSGSSEVDTLVQSASNGQTPSSCPIYAVPDKPKRGVPRPVEQDQFLSCSGIPLMGVSKNRRRNVLKRRALLQNEEKDSEEGIHRDDPCCNQPSGSTQTPGSDRNEYQAIWTDEADTAGPDPTYADVTRHRQSESGDCGQSTARGAVAEETDDALYARIGTTGSRNSAKGTLSFGAVL